MVGTLSGVASVYVWLPSTLSITAETDDPAVWPVTATWPLTPTSGLFCKTVMLETVTLFVPELKLAVTLGRNSVAALASAFTPVNVKTRGPTEAIG